MCLADECPHMDGTGTLSMLYFWSQISCPYSTACLNKLWADCSSPSYPQQTQAAPCVRWPHPQDCSVSRALVGPRHSGWMKAHTEISGLSRGFGLDSMHMELGKAQACRPGALCGGGKWLMWLLIFLSLPEQRHKHTTAPFRQQYLSSYMTMS